MRSVTIKGEILEKNDYSLFAEIIKLLSKNSTTAVSKRCSHASDLLV